MIAGVTAEGFLTTAHNRRLLRPVRIGWVLCQIAVNLFVIAAVPTVILVLLDERTAVHTDSDIVEPPTYGVLHDQKLALRCQSEP